LENGIGGCGPGEGAAAAVILVDEVLDAGDEVAEAAEVSAANRLLCNQLEPAFDLIEPGAYVGV